MKKVSSSQFIICSAVYAYCHTYSVKIMCYYIGNESLVIKSWQFVLINKADSYSFYIPV